MIDVAERLFAERGIGGVSLREVGAAAGQRNNSAAQYHFGSKDGLLAALFERRMATINERRLALLASVPDGDVHGIVDAWFRPYAEAVLVDPPTGYAGFVAQVVSHPAFEAFRQSGRQVTAGLDEAMSRLGEALTALPAEVATARLRLAAVAAVHGFADLERRIALGEPPPPIDRVMGNLADALTGLLTAPVREVR